MDQVLSFQPSIHLPRRNFHSLRGIFNRHYSKVDMPICSCFQSVSPSACVLLYLSLQSRRSNFVVSQPQTLRFPLFIYTFYMFYTVKTKASSAHQYRGSSISSRAAPCGQASSDFAPLSDLRSGHTIGRTSCGYPPKRSFFGASVQGLEHKLSPRGVCSRILHFWAFSRVDMGSVHGEPIL